MSHCSGDALWVSVVVTLYESVEWWRSMSQCSGDALRVSVVVTLYESVKWWRSTSQYSGDALRVRVVKSVENRTVYVLCRPRSPSERRDYHMCSHTESQWAERLPHVLTHWVAGSGGTATCAHTLCGRERRDCHMCSHTRWQGAEGLPHELTH